MMIRLLAACVFALSIACAVASIPSKTNLRFGEITEQHLADDSISAKKLQPQSITNRNIQNEAVDGDKLARFAIDERHFAPRAVTTKAMAMETVTIILRAETPVSTPGGASVQPTNRILLKPQDIGESAQIENHYVSPDGFYSAFGRASGPGVILGWYPSLNGHLLRYQSDRALRTLSCSNVYTEEHVIRKYDVNIADYSNPAGSEFTPRLYRNGMPSGYPISTDLITEWDPFARSDTEGQFGYPVPNLATINDGFGDDTRTVFPSNFGVFSIIASPSHPRRASFENALTGYNTAGTVDQDARGTRDTHHLIHRYSDLAFPTLCGDLQNDFGPDNVKCRAAQPWAEVLYTSNDAASADGDTTDHRFPTLDRTEGFAATSDFPFAGWDRGANANTPPERCSIYTNVGDVRTEAYSSDLPEYPGPAEGTPVYSPSLERIQMDETGQIEVRYAGRGLPGASQPDVAITVVVLLNNKVQNQQFGQPISADIELFP